MAALSEPEAPTPPTKTPAAPAPTDQRAALFGRIEKAAVYAICVVVMVVAGIALYLSASHTDDDYAKVIAQVGTGGGNEQDKLAVTAVLTGMRDLAALRSELMFVGFIVVLMGCVFVLKGVEAAYNLQVQVGEKQTSFSTASPGLILITAGVVMVLYALHRDAQVNMRLEPNPPSPPPAEVESRPDAGLDVARDGG